MYNPAPTQLPFIPSLTAPQISRPVPIKGIDPKSPLLASFCPALTVTFSATSPATFVLTFVPVLPILKNPLIAFLIPGPIALLIPINAFLTAVLMTLPAILNGKVISLAVNEPRALANLPARLNKPPRALLIIRTPKTACCKAELISMSIFLNAFLLPSCHSAKALNTFLRIIPPKRAKSAFLTLSKNPTVFFSTFSNFGFNSFSISGSSNSSSLSFFILFWNAKFCCATNSSKSFLSVAFPF